MSDVYEVFSLDEVLDTDVSDIADENVCDIPETENVQNWIPMAAMDNEEPLETVTECAVPVMRPVEGLVIDLDRSGTDGFLSEDVTEYAAEQDYCLHTDYGIPGTGSLDTGALLSLDDITEDGLNDNSGSPLDTDADGLESADSVEDADMLLSADFDEDMETEPFETGAEADNIADSADGGAYSAKGMTITEFLRANPQIRDKGTLEKYFSAECVERALRSGAIMCMHGKITL